MRKYKILIYNMIFIPQIQNFYSSCYLSATLKTRLSRTLLRMTGKASGRLSAQSATLNVNAVWWRMDAARDL
jgi:hypothetical protein